ncbi:MAG: purine-nucleoside phosphorylase [Ignavibacteria bacterium]
MNNKIGIILGSGLNKFTEELYAPQVISEDKNSFHHLTAYKGKISGKEIILFSGRRHFYEGYEPGMILENVNRAKEHGVTTLIVTNAAGGLNKGFRVSDLMLITSHLNFLNTPIPSDDHAILYHKNISEKIKQIAKEENILLRYGSYCCAQGPMYETRSEIRYLSKLGIDAVGMSTIPEIIHANKIGMKTIAFSCITNLLSESSDSVTDHDEVIEAGKIAYNNFSKLLTKIVERSEELHA